MATGGDNIQMTCNHSVLGSFVFFFKANEDGTVMRGGYGSNDDANMVTGDGRMLDQMNRKLGSFETPPIEWDMVGADELDQLRQLQSSPIRGNWTITNISGAIWGGVGKPVGDIGGSTNTGLVNSIKIAFEGDGPKRLS